MKVRTRGGVEYEVADPPEHMEGQQGRFEGPDGIALAGVLVRMELELQRVERERSQLDQHLLQTERQLMGQERRLFYAEIKIDELAGRREAPILDEVTGEPV